MPDAAETEFAVDAYVKRLFVPHPSGIYKIKFSGYWTRPSACFNSWLCKMNRGSRFGNSSINASTLTSYNLKTKSDYVLNNKQ